MSLDKFDYVLALAEERNLTCAAKKTFISTRSDNYINKLESQLGVVVRPHSDPNPDYPGGGTVH